MTDVRRSHVFLSYNEENQAFVEALARRLKDDARLTFWFRPWHAIPGEDIQAQMEQALGEAQSCAVFLGAGGLDGRPPSAIGGWQNEQMRAAIQARVEDATSGGPPYRVIPVLLPGAARPRRRDLPAFLRLYEAVEFRSADDEQAFRSLLAGILGIPPIEVEGFLAARVQAAPSAIVETPPRQQFEPLHIDPDHPPIRAIRDLLLAAFTPKALHAFCQDRPDFRPVLTGFGADLVLDAMVTKVIEYCDTQLLWDELLAEVAQVSPRQYARFEPQLKQT